MEIGTILLPLNVQVNYGQILSTCFRYFVTLTMSMYILHLAWGGGCSIFTHAFILSEDFA